MADSREEKIIKSMLGEQVELEPPQSRIEVLLYELKDAIEQGGGGGGGGSAEPFFFVVEVKGVDPQSGEPIIEETSTTYNNLMSMIADGRPIYCKLIIPQELAVEMDNPIESIDIFESASHDYDSINDENVYVVEFAHMQFHSSVPNAMLVSDASRGGGGDDTPVT